jgi:hypothetical protein
MVKRREPKVTTPEPLAEQMEAFVAGAEDGQLVISTDTPVINKNAIRDYKAIRVPFNEYEYQQLELASQLSGRTKLNFIRYAMLQLAKEIQQDG